MDGFLIVLDKEANVLYVSETIVDCVGLRQVTQAIIMHVAIEPSTNYILSNNSKFCGYEVILTSNMR